MTATAITNGLSVTVSTRYLPEHSLPSANKYVFTYRIRIENNSTHTVQLLRRHWFIHDAGSQLKQVEGPGVVGQQPVLEPGQVHEYVSGCHLQSPIGKMTGHYTMERLVDGKTFQVVIPEFVLMLPYLQN